MLPIDEPLMPSPRDQATALTPSKRIRVNDTPPPEDRSAEVSNVTGTSHSSTSRGDGITAAQLEQLLGTRILPHLVEQMNDKFSTLQTQYLNTVKQASKMFEEVQNAMVTMQKQQTLLSTTLAAEQQTLETHQHAIRTVKQEQDDAQQSIGIQKANLEHVYDKQVTMEKDMHSFASSVMAGFSKTEDICRKQLPRTARTECDRCETNSDDSLLIDGRLLGDISMGQDDRKLRTPVRREPNNNNVGKRNSCPTENENAATTTPRRSSCPVADETGNMPTSSEDFDSQQILMLEKLASDRQVGSTPAYTNFKVTAPPVFSVEKYSVWRKELVFWRELYFYVPDLHLLSVLGLHADSILKSLLMKFHYSTRDDGHRRTLSNLLRLLDENYLITSKERELKQMDKLMDLRRSADENVISFWMKFESILQALDGCSSQLSESFLFIRALKSLNVNQVQRSSLMTFIECQNLTHSWPNLKKASVKLFGIYTEVASKGSNVFQSETSGGNLSIDLGEQDQLLLVRRGGKPSRNRPGMEQQAIRRTQESMNMPNKTMTADSGTEKNAVKGEGKCFRCGKRDHILRNCPLPFTPVLAFAPNRSKASPPNRTFTTETSEELSTEKTMESGSHLTDSTSMVEENIEQGQWISEEPQGGEETWISEWLDTVDDIQEIAVCDSYSMELENYVDWTLHSQTTTTFSDLPYLLIDSGASSSVAGKSWLQKWLSFGGIDVFPALTPSSKVFRFGNGLAFASCGSIAISGRVLARNSANVPQEKFLAFEIDVITLNLPFLVSRKSLTTLQCQLDFSENCLSFKNGWKISTSVTSSGHVSFDWFPHKHSVDFINAKLPLQPVTVFVADSPDSAENERRARKELYVKLHRHLGHVPSSTVIRICKNAGKTVVASEVMQAVRDCNCGRAESHPQNPVISQYRGCSPGEIVFSDIIYPMAHQQDKPAILFVDSFSRFCVARFLPNIRPSSIIAILLEVWAIVMGMPNVLVVDSGRSYQGEEWRTICDLYNFVMVTAPTKAHYQCGLVEKHGSLISRAFEATVRASQSKLSDALILACICVAKNTTALSHCPIAPLTLLTGRTDYLERIMMTRKPSDCEIQGSDSLRAYWDQIQQILSFRQMIIKADAEQMLSLAAGKNLRVGCNNAFVHHQSVQCWDDTHKCWKNGYRFLSDSGHNALIEHNGKIIKIQKQWIRTNVVDLAGQEDPRKTVSLSVMNRPDGISHTNQSSPLTSVDNVPTVPNQQCEPSSSSMRGEGARGLLPRGNATQRPKVLPFKKYNLRSDSSNFTGMLSVVGEDLYTMAGNDEGIFSNIDEDTKECDTEAMEFSLKEEFGNFDLSRIPPRIFLSHPDARRAAREELRGLMRVDSQGIPIGRLVDCRDPKFHGFQRLHTTTVCKLKPNKGFKVRLCLRGDMQRESQVHFVSAPTVGRDFIKLFVSLFVLHPSWILCTVDITKAFTQSDYLAKNDRCLAVLPPYFQSHSSSWDGYIATNHLCTEYEGDGIGKNGERNVHVASRDTFDQKIVWGLLLFRPLYGSRDAPMRWWISISTCLRRHHFQQLRSDCCVFGCFKDTTNDVWATGIKSAVQCLILLHVDDIIYVGDNACKEKFLTAIKEFEHGPVEYLGVNSEIVYCGISIRMNRERSVSLSQCAFYNKMVELQERDILKDGKFIIPELKRRKLLKSFVGGCLWLTQTRFDLSFSACKLASSLVGAVQCPLLMKTFVTDARRLMQRLQKGERFIWFHNFLKNLHSSRFPQLTTFADASYGTLRDSGSAESACFIFGIPLKRDGTILCRGHLISWYARRIARVCRSTANAECIALNGAVDVTVYLQVIIGELLTGIYDVQFLVTGDIIPLLNPFRRPPPIEAIKAESVNIGHSSIESRDSVYSSSCSFRGRNYSLAWNSLKDSWIISFCSSCCVDSRLSLPLLVDTYNCFAGLVRNNRDVLPDVPRSRPFICALALSDCANIISCLSRGNPRTEDKSSRLILNQLKDAMQYLNISFVCAPFNVADVGTKMNSNLSIFYRLIQSGYFRVGFMSRRDCRIAVENLKLSPQEPDSSMHTVKKG